MALPVISGAIKYFPSPAGFLYNIHYITPMILSDSHLGWGFLDNMIVIINNCAFKALTDHLIMLSTLSKFYSTFIKCCNHNMFAEMFY